MAGYRQTMTGTLTIVALAAGLLVGGAGLSAAETVTATVTVDHPNPKEHPIPGTHRDPRCDHAENGLAIAKANVAKARQRLKAAPKKKKPARRAALKSAKQRRISAKALVKNYC